MKDQDKVIIKSVLNTLNLVTYNNAIEIERIKNTPNSLEKIEEFEVYKKSIEDLLQKLFPQ